MNSTIPHVLSKGMTGTGMDGGTWTQRPYWVMLDTDRQEVGPRTWLRRQPFTDLDYARRWCQWVQAQGAVPAPDRPKGPE